MWSMGLIGQIRPGVFLRLFPFPVGRFVFAFAEGFVGAFVLVGEAGAREGGVFCVLKSQLILS